MLYAHTSVANQYNPEIQRYYSMFNVRIHNAGVSSRPLKTAFRASKVSASKMAPSSVRSLHWVFKIGDRTATHKFLSEILGMEVLRHEEVGGFSLRRLS